MLRGGEDKSKVEEAGATGETGVGEGRHSGKELVPGGDVEETTEARVQDVEGEEIGVAVQMGIELGKAESGV